jgi:hypothetical protein
MFSFLSNLSISPMYKNDVNKIQIWGPWQFSIYLPYLNPTLCMASSISKTTVIVRVIVEAGPD